MDTARRSNNEAEIAKPRIAGLTFTITQDSETAPDCTYNIFPLFESRPAAGGSGSINVVTDERRGWKGSKQCQLENGYLELR